MAKVVYNACYGGFSLSKAAVVWLAEHGCEAAKKEIADKEAAVAGDKSKYQWSQNPDYWWKRDVENWTSNESSFMGYGWHPDDEELSRDSELLVQCVEALGEKAGGSCSQLRIEEVPSGSSWRIDEYDGSERVMTREDYKWKTAP